MADLIVKRLPDNISVDDVVDADLIMHYIASFDDLYWFPKTYVYRSDEYRSFELLSRLQSLRHFDKVKILFNVSSVKEFQDKIKSLKEKEEKRRRLMYQNSHSWVTPIYQHIDIEKIGTIR